MLSFYRIVLLKLDREIFYLLRLMKDSYTDTFSLLSLDEEINEDYGLFVHVKRKSDNKNSLYRWPI